MKRICLSPHRDFVESVSGKILVGTASWSDPGFVERWYPKKLPAGDRLPWYAQHFDLVEVNSTFYSVPEPRMVERWCAATPDDFTFDVKLHQLFSFHSTPAKLLPPDLQSRAETDAKGKVKPTPRHAGGAAQSFSARDVNPSQRWKNGRSASATFAGVFAAKTSS